MAGTSSERWRVLYEISHLFNSPVYAFDEILEIILDMAIRISTLGDSRMVARPLAPVRMIACASPAFLQRQGTPVSPAELRDYPFIS